MISQNLILITTILYCFVNEILPLMDVKYARYEMPRGQFRMRYVFWLEPHDQLISVSTFWCGAKIDILNKKKLLTCKVEIELLKLKRQCAGYLQICVMASLAFIGPPKILGPP